MTLLGLAVAAGGVAAIATLVGVVAAIVAIVATPLRITRCAASRLLAWHILARPFLTRPFLTRPFLTRPFLMRPVVARWAHCGHARTGHVPVGRSQAPHFTHLGLIQINKTAPAQATRQHHTAVADADQPADAQAHLVKQLAHLAVAAFGDDHAVPAVHALATAVFNRFETGALAVDLHAVQQAVARLGLQRAQHPHRVFTLHAKTRVHQLVGQFARVGKQQQPFGVDVKPAHRLPFAMRQARQAAKHRGPVLRVVMRDHLAHRLVVGHDARRWWCNAHLDDLAGHADAVAKRDALAGMRGLAIDHHLAFGNQRFHVAARADARLGQHLVQLGGVGLGGQHTPLRRRVGVGGHLGGLGVVIARQHGGKGFTRIQRRSPGLIDRRRCGVGAAVVVIIAVIVITRRGGDGQQASLIGRWRAVVGQRAVGAAASAPAAVAVAAARAVGIGIGIGQTGAGINGVARCDAGCHAGRRYGCGGHNTFAAGVNRKGHCKGRGRRHCPRRINCRRDGGCGLRRHLLRQRGWRAKRHHDRRFGGRQDCGQQPVIGITGRRNSASDFGGLGGRYIAFDIRYCQRRGVRHIGSGRCLCCCYSGGRVGDLAGTLGLEHLVARRHGKHRRCFVRWCVVGRRLGANHALAAWLGQCGFVSLRSGALQVGSGQIVVLRVHACAAGKESSDSGTVAGAGSRVGGSTARASAACSPGPSFSRDGWPAEPGSNTAAVGGPSNAGN